MTHGMPNRTAAARDAREAECIAEARPLAFRLRGFSSAPYIDLRTRTDPGATGVGFPTRVRGASEHEPAWSLGESRDDDAPRPPAVGQPGAEDRHARAQERERDEADLPARRRDRRLVEQRSSRLPRTGPPQRGPDQRATAQGRDGSPGADACPAGADPGAAEPG